MLRCQPLKFSAACVLPSIGFQASSYNVTEGDGSIQVCAVVVDFSEPTPIGIFTTDGTAIG